MHSPKETHILPKAEERMNELIAVNNTIEISGTVTAVGTDNITLSLTEIYLDSQWRKFSPAKSLTVLTTDYDTNLTPQELKLVDKLAAAAQTSSSLTEDEKVIAASIAAKLNG